MDNDFLSHVDGRQHVVLRRPGSDFETQIVGALLRPFRSQRRLTIHESVVPRRLAHWYFSRHEISAAPHEGDEIEDKDGNRWTILEVHASELNGTWQCAARTYAIRFGLDEHVDQLRAAYSKSPAGTLIRNFRMTKTGIAARFSPATIDPENGSKTFYALVRETLEFEPGDMLRRADGSRYEIEKVRLPQFLGDWTEIALK